MIALVFALLAFGSYRLGVHTLKGQGYEDLVIGNFANYTPQWLLRHNLGLTDSVVVISVSISLGAIAVFVALLRRRWWLAGQLVAFAAVSFACARVLKPALLGHCLCRFIRPPRTPRPADTRCSPSPPDSCSSARCPGRGAPPAPCSPPPTPCSWASL